MIIGGSGFIGTKLAEELLKNSYEVVILDLVPPKISHERLSFSKVNVAVQPIDPELFSGVYGVINLAGATIGKRWNDAYQKLIYDSRIQTTKHIVDTLSGLQEKPVVLVSASAVGYYGDQRDVVLKEDHAPGKDFLAKLCVDWELEAKKAELLGVRVVCIRTAHVLGPGGLLSTLEPIFKWGIGGYFGNGAQYMPWIHYRDVVGIYQFVLERELRGSFNVGAGNTITQKQLFKSFAHAIHRVCIFRIPLFVARLILGAFADSLVTSQRTDSSVITHAGYQYQFDDIDIALYHLYTKQS